MIVYKLCIPLFLVKLLDYQLIPGFRGHLIILFSFFLSFSSSYLLLFFRLRQSTAYGAGLWELGLPTYGLMIGAIMI